MKGLVYVLGYRERRRRAMSVAAGAAAGAGMMYLFDPERGARRRGLLRDKFASSSRRAVRAIDKGARDLRNRANRLPTLTGQSVFREDAPRRAGRPHVYPIASTPAGRLLFGIAGAGLFLYALAARRPVLPALAGATLLVRAISNLPLRRLLGLEGRRGVDIRKTLVIDAPLEGVYAFWADLENFPRIMSHVREVQRTGPDRFQWKVDGPAGIPVEWTATITKHVPDEILAWKSEEGSVIRQAGVVRFDPEPGGGTRLDIKLSYNPPLGAVGHTVASLLAADPKSMIDDDLMRFKSLMETGKTRAHDRSVTIEDISPPAPLTAEMGTPHAGR